MLLWPGPDHASDDTWHREWVARRPLAAHQAHPPTAHRCLWNHRVPGRRSSHKSTGRTFPSGAISVSVLFNNFWPPFPVRSPVVRHAAGTTGAAIHQGMESGIAKTFDHRAGRQGQLWFAGQAEKGEENGGWRVLGQTFGPKTEPIAKRKWKKGRVSHANWMAVASWKRNWKLISIRFAGDTQRTAEGGQDHWSLDIHRRHQHR